MKDPAKKKAEVGWRIPENIMIKKMKESEKRVQALTIEKEKTFSYL